MFKDYYQILNIEYSADNQEIKKAFKTQALKYHPDKNIGKNTTTIMQEITEAYYVLKHPETKSKYDVEYLRYYQQANQDNQEFKYKDIELEEYIRFIILNISKYTEEMIKETSYLIKEGYKTAGNEMMASAISILIAGLILSVLIAAC